MRLSAVYLIESQFMEDKYKFFRCVPSRSLITHATRPLMQVQRCAFSNVSDGEPRNTVDQRHVQDGSSEQ